MCFRYVKLLLVMFAISTTLSGCSGGKPAPTAEPPVTKIQNPASPPGFSLPAPSTLLAAKAEAKHAAYVEADLVKDAADCNPAWPWNKIAPVGTQVVFSPSWTDASSCDCDDLAYCMWEFVIPGYDRNPQVRYDWATPLSNPNEGWIALANWAADRWDWYVCKPHEKLDLASLDPYFTGSDTLALVIVRIGTAESTLNEVRIGGIPPFAELSTSAAKGIVPLNVDFDGSGSLDDDGTIVKYEWDLDGDGSFETDTGSNAETSHNYSSNTQIVAVMRVTDNDGLTSTDSVSVVALEPDGHTWGGSDAESLLDFAVTSSNLYCVGYTATYVGSNTNSLILLKYTLTGDLVWAKAFRGSDSEVGTAVVVNGDGDIIVAGRTWSWGAGGADMLVQKWSPEGSPLWSKVYGGSGTDQANAVALDGDDIYLAGYTSTEAYTAGMEDALFVKLNTDGDVQWATTWGGDDQDFARDIKKVPSFAGLHAFRMTGETKSFGEGGSDVIYLTLTGSGYITDQYTWGDSFDQAGNAIRVGLNGSDPYICGYSTYALGKKALLLKFDTGDTFARKYWSRTGIHEAFDLAYTGGNFYLVGNYKEESASIWNGFLMIVDDAGWNMKSMHYTNQTIGVQFRSLAMFGGSAGVFACGDMDDADGSITNTFNDAAHDAIDNPWQVAAGTSGFVSLSSQATNGAGVETITTAIIDSGGGGRDAAWVLLDF